MMHCEICGGEVIYGCGIRLHQANIAALVGLKDISDFVDVHDDGSAVSSHA